MDNMRSGNSSGNHICSSSTTTTKSSGSSSSSNSSSKICKMFIFCVVWVVVVATATATATTTTTAATTTEAETETETTTTATKTGTEKTTTEIERETSLLDGDCPTTTTSKENERELMELELVGAPLETCKDDEERCAGWANLGECDHNPNYMHIHCKKSCNICNENDDDDRVSKDVFLHKNAWGEPQQIRLSTAKHIYEQQYSYEKVYDQLVATQQYMISTVYQSKEYETVRDECKNRHVECTFWASIGECQKNPTYMEKQCAPACQTCLLLDFNYRCPYNSTEMHEQSIWKPGDLHTMFHEIITHPSYQQYHPVVYSKPKTEVLPFTVNEFGIPIIPNGPWVVTLENFITDEECDKLIQLGGGRGYDRSYDVGEQLFDGTYDKYENPFRTSTNAWCLDECYNDPITQQIIKKMEHVTGIPDANSEYLQLLRYEETQFYQQHHDYISYQINRQEGVRLLTLFMYLNDVTEGGGTNFPLLNLTIMPKRGKALLWPSVLNENPDLKDGRTEHQALPVDKGIKFGANAWFHARDFKDPYARGCV